MTFGSAHAGRQSRSEEQYGLTIWQPYRIAFTAGHDFLASPTIIL
jgi:hypothetical protein